MALHDEVKYLDYAHTQELITEVKTRLATKNKVFQLVSMPTLTSENISQYAGNIYQYTGNTTEYFSNSAFYKADSTDPLDLKWVKTTYNKDEIDNAIATKNHFIVVSELPVSNIDPTAIYLVPAREYKTGYSNTSASPAVFYVKINNSSYASFDNSTGDYIETITESADVAAIDAAIAAGTYTEGSKLVEYGAVDGTKDEYIYLTSSSHWEKIGSTEMDLSSYVQFSDLVAITSAELETMWNQAV